VAVELDYRPEARADLASIYAWLADRSDAAAAFAYVSRIEAACQRLIEFPRRGSPHDPLEPGLRSVPFERRATIYYRVTESAVEIVRVLYAGLDADREFKR